MKAFDSYASVLVVLTIALLLIAAGVGKKQFVGKRLRRCPFGAGVGQ